jgi:ComF family protein
MFESPHDSEICESCENSNPYFDLARAIFQYNDASKRIVMNIKKKSDNYTAKICAKMILTRYENIFGEVDYITPVPSHWTRLLVRGFNPANIVAYELSKISNVKYAHLLKRTRRTDYQRNKSVSERSANVSGAFSRNQRKTNDINCKNIILVDDVLTTGSTLNECAQTLKSLGANHVSCITIANTNRR